MRFGAIEAGGTKMVCAVTDERGTIYDRAVFPTKSPETTIDQMISYFQDKQIQSLGIASFGPLELKKDSPNYGHIRKTPKKGWTDVDLVTPFQNALQVPVGLDTDVNGAVLSEVVWGAAKGCETAVYMTVGTGIGIGVFANGGLLHGMMHPEAGHMLMTRNQEDWFPGVCPFHDSCLEGLASGPAIERRWGWPAKDLYHRKEVWELEAYYLGQAVANIILTLSPDKIIIGGGVMHKEDLLPQIHSHVKIALNRYILDSRLERGIVDYIVPPALGEDSGILGAACLAISVMG